MDELSKELQKLGLRLTRTSNKTYSVGLPHIANPLLHFNAENKGKQYNGSTTVKLINVRLFSSEQVHGALKLVDDYLYF